MTRPVQYFTKEYLERCKGMTPEQIIEFIEDFRTLIFSTHFDEKKLFLVAKENKNSKL